MHFPGTLEVLAPKKKISAAFFHFEVGTVVNRLMQLDSGYIGAALTRRHLRYICSGPPVFDNASCLYIFHIRVHVRMSVQLVISD